jgi:hypothetical protein
MIKKCLYYQRADLYFYCLKGLTNNLQNASQDFNKMFTALGKYFIFSHSSKKIHRFTTLLEYLLHDITGFLDLLINLIFAFQLLSVLCIIIGNFLSDLNIIEYHYLRDQLKLNENTKSFY